MPNESTTDRLSRVRRVAVVGLGQMGLVAAQMLESAAREGSPSGAAAAAPAGPPTEVVIWGRDIDGTAEVAQTRTSPRLPGFILPDAVRVVLNPSDALREADVVVSAIPTQSSRAAWTMLREHLPARAGVVSVAKGIETKTLRRPTQVLAEAIGDNPDAAARPIGVLSGPTIAEELARCLPATMISASDDHAFAELVQRLFNASWLRVYTNPDVLGVELAGATKNIIAIAAGIVDGLGAGRNAKSALLARGLAEISRLGIAMGASPETFFGIAGVGDLATSCFSPAGRNRSCGEALGKGELLETYLERSPMVVEGVETTRAVMELAGKYRVDMPITSAVHAVLYEKLDPVDAIGRLMTRDLKGEQIN